LFDIGAACWYFGQRLSELGVTVPIGLADTAIGGQRIEEYMKNSTIGKCSDISSQDVPWWNAQLFATQVTPFVDMTVKGFVWYQGENNMGATKGNSIANVGYGCEQLQLIKGWREVWSETPGTTDPEAPFGVVTLASSGSEGGAHMGAMRQAQTANYGILPNIALPNTFLAQAYDLDDTWGPVAGPCFTEWACCRYGYRAKFNATTCNSTTEKLCTIACAANADTPVKMGGIHPRAKEPVGNRLGTAAFNTVYGGKAAFTGPTLSRCSVKSNLLEIRFSASLLRGDVLKLNKWGPVINTPGYRGKNVSSGGPQLYVQTNASAFCMESLPVVNHSAGERPPPSKFSTCPTWAGGDGKVQPVGFFDSESDWIPLNFSLDTSSSIKVDLTPLNGAVPTAVRYAWGVLNCCDLSDPMLYITHGCLATCPIMSSSGLPANPFQAKIVDGECECVAPQVCSGPEDLQEAFV